MRSSNAIYQRFVALLPFFINVKIASDTINNKVDLMHNIAAEKNIVFGGVGGECKVPGGSIEFSLIKWNNCGE